MKPQTLGNETPKVRSGRGLRALLAGAMTAALVSTGWAAAPPPGAQPKQRPASPPAPQDPEGSDVKYKLSDEALQEEGKDPATIKGPRPIIKAEMNSHDFGPVWVGPDLKHEFTIKNEGDAPLEILSVKPSCGCTIAGTYPHKLGPGESGKFPFSMKSEKLRGNFAKHITITSNDPVDPRLQLTLRGEVKRFVEVTPSSASFGRITDQTPQTRELAIINNTDKPLKLELDTKDAKAFEYKLEEKEPGKRYALQITTKPPFSEGRLNEGVILRTNLDEQKEIEVRSMAAVPARIEVQPDSVIINAQAPVERSAQPLSRVLRFTNYGDTPAKLLEATVDDPLVTAAIREREEGEAYTIEVTMPAGYEPPAQGRTITLKIDDPQISKIEVPIRLIGRPNAEAAAQVERPQPEELVGKPAPAFNLETVDGKQVSNENIKDSVTVLNFFAPNCGFCKKQIPRLETVRQKYESQNVRFVNVSQKMGAKDFTKEEVIELQKQLGFHGELALNHDNSVGQQFKVSGFPSMFVIGKDGSIVSATSGNAADLETRVSSQIDAQLSGKASGGATATQPGAEPTPNSPKPSGHSAAPRAAGEKSVRLASFVQDPPPAPPKNPPVKVSAQDVKPAAPAPAPARVRPDTLVGKPAPTMSLKTTAGKDLSNDTFDDVPATVLNFFAGNCGYCKKQIPRLETIRKEYEAKGVRFVNVAETMRQEYSEQEIMDILKQTGWEGEVARDPKNEFGPPFGASGFPTMVVVGKSGKIEATNVGNVADLETRMKGQLDALIEGKPIPPQFAQAPPKPADAAAAAKPEDMVGKPIPAFEMKTSDGKTVSSTSLAASKATVLNFFAPNCGFCKKQIPRLETVRKEYAGKPVEFVQVKETMGKEFTDEEAIATLKELGIEAPAVAQDPGNATGKKFNVRGFPTMVVLGNGKVQAVNVGNIGDLESRLKGQLDSLIEGKDLAQAPPAAPAAAPGSPGQAQAGAKAAPTDWVGHPAPAFSLKTLDGKSIETGNLGDAKATVLNFFAPNCGFCKKQIPRMETLRKEYEEKGVRFVQVKETMGKEFTDEDATKTLTEVGWEGDMAPDSGNAVGQKFNVRGFPTMMVLGANGKVQAANVGNIGDLETKLKEQLDTLIAGKDVATAPAPPPSAEAAAPKRRPAEEMRGQKAPGFTLTTLDGKTVSSEDFPKHKATVLNFVAPNCGFCKKQVPTVEKVRAEYEAKGVRFVNMVQKMGTKDFEHAEITDIFKQAGSNLDLAKDEGNKVGTQYKVVSFPTMFVVSNDGTIAEVAIGAKADLETTLRAKLDELTKGS